MDSRKRFSSGDPSDSELPPPERSSSSHQPSSPANRRSLTSPSSPRHPSSLNNGLALLHPSPRGNSLLNGNAVPSMVVHASTRPHRVAMQVFDSNTATSQIRPFASHPRAHAARESRGRVLPPANPQVLRSPHAPSLIGLTAIRRSNCYPTFLARRHGQPPTSPTSLTSSLEVEVANDDTTSPPNVDATVCKPPIPWDPDYDLRGVGGGVGIGPDQPQA